MDEAAKAAKSNPEVGAMLDAIAKTDKGASIKAKGLLEDLKKILQRLKDNSTIADCVLFLALHDDKPGKLPLMFRENWTVGEILEQYWNSEYLRKRVYTSAVHSHPERPKQDRDKISYDVIDRVLAKWPLGQPMPVFLYAWLHAHWRNPSKPRDQKVKNTFRDIMIACYVIFLREECGIPFDTDNRKPPNTPVTACHLVAATVNLSLRRVRDIWEKYDEGIRPEIMPDGVKSRPKKRRRASS